MFSRIKVIPYSLFGLMAATPLYALEEDANTAITAAGTSATASVGLASSTVIGIVVAVVGLGLIITILKRV